MCSTKLHPREFLTPIKDVPKQQLSKILNIKFSILSTTPLNNINNLYDNDGNECPSILIDYRDCLDDINEFTCHGGVIPSVCYPNILTMFEVNIDRNKPLTRFYQHSFDFEEEDEPYLDLSWFYLQHLYDLFLRLIDSSNLNFPAFEQLITERLLNKILRAFNNQDNRERDFLRLLLHKVYGKFVKMRLFLRRRIGHIFINFAYSDDIFYGIEELLAVLVSIINGFALPLKESHKDYLEHQIMPLHKSNMIFVYFRQLSNCVVQYIQKDQRLSSLVITLLFKYWPRNNSSKELLFMTQLEEVISRSNNLDMSNIIDPLFKKLASLFQSPHFQISEHALLFFNNENFLKLVAENIPQAMGEFVPSIQIALQHWNSSIRILTLSIIDIMKTLGGNLYQTSLSQYYTNIKEDADKREKNKVRWEIIEKIAQQSSLD